MPDITNLATKTTLSAKINELKVEIPSITNLVTTAALNTKIKEVKNKILNITNLATTTATLIALENKIHSVSNLVKKTDFNTKNNEVEKKITDYDHDRYITTPGFNKLTAEKFAATLAQANVTTEMARLKYKTYFK